MHVHSREPNYEPPSADPTFTLVLANGVVHTITVGDLHDLPVTTVGDCFIVTDHGTIGPLVFAGVTLPDLWKQYGQDGVAWSEVDVVSGDGFSASILADEANTSRPPLLIYTANGLPLTRQEGLVRLVVPDDEANALRQIKWVSQLCFRV